MLGKSLAYGYVDIESGRDAAVSMTRTFECSSCAER
jgi:hypothetical protein